MAYVVPASGSPSLVSRRKYGWSRQRSVAGDRPLLAPCACQRSASASQRVADAVSPFARAMCGGAHQPVDLGGDGVRGVAGLVLPPLLRRVRRAPARCRRRRSRRGSRPPSSRARRCAAPSRPTSWASTIGSATSSSWSSVQTGVPLTSEFCGNEPSGFCCDGEQPVDDAAGGGLVAHRPQRGAELVGVARPDQVVGARRRRQVRRPRRPTPMAPMGEATNAPGCSLSSAAASTSAEARYCRRTPRALAGTLRRPSR